MPHLIKTVLFVKSPYGRWQNQDDQSVCNKCSQGKISKRIQQVSDNTCEECAIGLYNPYDGHNGACLPCRTASKKGASECDGCDPGKYQHATVLGDIDDDDDCDVCPLGKFTNERDVDSCKLCPKGYYTNDQMYQNKVRLNRCQECVRGTYGDQMQQKTKEECKQCVAGRYNDIEGLAKESKSVCKACSSGKYSQEQGNAKDSKCRNCGSGKWSSEEAASSAIACKKCHIGRFSADVGVQDRISCKKCDLGFEQMEAGQAYCLPCSPGKVGKQQDGIHVCSLCLANTYSNVVAKQTACKDCATGRTSGIGAVSCSLCPAGQHIDSSGCAKCLTGQYQSDMEQLSCNDCEKGKVASIQVSSHEEPSPNVE